MAERAEASSRSEDDDDIAADRKLLTDGVLVTVTNTVPVLVTKIVDVLKFRLA